MRCWSRICVFPISSLVLFLLGELRGTDNVVLLDRSNQEGTDDKEGKSRGSRLDHGKQYPWQTTSGSSGRPGLISVRNAGRRTGSKQNEGSRDGLDEIT